MTESLFGAPHRQRKRPGGGGTSSGSPPFRRLGRLHDPSLLSRSRSSAKTFRRRGRCSLPKPRPRPTFGTCISCACEPGEHLPGPTRAGRFVGSAPGRAETETHVGSSRLGRPFPTSPLNNVLTHGSSVPRKERHHPLPAHSSFILSLSLYHTRNTPSPSNRNRRISTHIFRN